MLCDALPPTCVAHTRVFCCPPQPPAPSADDIAPPAVPGGRGYFPVGDVKYAALTEGECVFRSVLFGDGLEHGGDVPSNIRELHIYIEAES